MTIYRMRRYSMLSSFANRITGMVLSAGLVLFIYWLTALARGAGARTITAAKSAAAPTLGQLEADLSAGLSMGLRIGLQELGT